MKKFVTALAAVLCLCVGLTAFAACGTEGTGTGIDGKLSGVIQLRGSTSVEPLMDKLVGAYIELNGDRVADVEFDKDSGIG